MIKRLLLLLLVCSAFISSQTEYVPVEHKIYPFLERMDALQIISDYNSFQLPKTRHQIADYLKEAERKKDKLDKIDRASLEDYKVEFELETSGTLSNSESLIGNTEYGIFNQKEKYIYLQNQPGIGTLFINLTGEGDFLLRNDRISGVGSTAKLGIIGGEIRGTILDKFGYFIKGTNGVLSGDKEAGFIRKDLQYNFKLNELQGSTFFDETQGYLTADYNLIRFKIGRDRLKIGYGYLGALIDNNSPYFDYLGMDINYGIINFSYLHAKIAGNVINIPDPVTGGMNIVGEKYIGFHRIGLNLSDKTGFGVGEFIIYANRPVEFSYLNPFNFYKSAEHAGEDRDNSMLFFDMSNKSIEGLKLSGYLLIDDISFGKIGTGWYGNQTIWNLGLNSSNLYHFLPLDIRVEYQRIEPYVFTHRLAETNFTNQGYGLGTFTYPNSELFFTEINYRFNYRCSASIGFIYGIHGANPLNSDGSVRNIGGDIALGHRVDDSETVHFLDGDLEYQRMVTGSVNYEPFKEINFNFKINYLSQSLQNSVSKREIQSFIAPDREDLTGNIIMNTMKNKFPYSLLILILGITLGFQIQKTFSSDNLRDSLLKYNDVLSYIDKYYVEDVDTHKLVEAAINGMLSKLDPHSVYIQPKQLENVEESFRGDFEGIGIEYQVVNDTLTVVSPITGGPSEALGILSGDRIIKIDDKGIIGISNDDVTKKLRGAAGTKVKVTIIRHGISTPQDYNITRDKIPIYSVDTHFMINDMTGYVSVSRFSETTYDEVVKALNDLKAKGMKQLIFDLRGNPGGYMEQAVKISDLFLDGKKKIVYTKSRRSEFDQSYYAGESSPFEKLPLILLVNKGSASASEIVSGAIQDWDRGLIVGETTFGKGLVQRQFTLSDNSALRLTISKYFTPSGRLIQRDYKKIKDKDEYYSEAGNDSAKQGDNLNHSAESDSGRQVFKTNGGRIVYGGGGITPDYIIKSEDITDYTTELLKNNIFYLYVLHFLDENSSKIKAKYGNDFQGFLKDYTVSSDVINSFTKYATQKNIKLHENDVKKDYAYICARIKAQIARNFWKNEGWYPVILQTDNQFAKALTLFNEAKLLAKLK